MADVLPLATKMSYGAGLEVDSAIQPLEFGDGYIQWQTAGLNSEREKWSVSWHNLGEDQYWPIYNFLKAHLRRGQISWQPPWESSPRTWKCTSLSGARPIDLNSADIVVTLEEDFNP